MDTLLKSLAGGSLAIAVFLIASSLLGQAKLRKAGWLVLTPTLGMHALLFICVVFEGLFIFTFIAQNLSPTRRDSQPISGILLITIFALTIAYLVRLAYSQRVAFRDNVVRHINWFGQASVHCLNNVVEARVGRFSGVGKLAFSDDKKLLFSLYLRGAKELLCRATERVSSSS